MTDTNDGVISETSFETEYRPLAGLIDGPVLDYEDVVGQPLEHVWTIVDGEDGNMYALAGFHIVNKVGYVVTEQPWVTGTEEAEWCIFDPDTREEMP